MELSRSFRNPQNMNIWIRPVNQHNKNPSPAGEGDSLNPSDIRESWMLSRKNQRSMILFVRAREHVIAVKPHRQAIFGLGIHIVPGKHLDDVVI